MSFFGLFPWFPTLCPQAQKHTPHEKPLLLICSKSKSSTTVCCIAFLKDFLCIEFTENYRNSEYPLHSCPQKSSDCLKVCFEA